MKTKLFLTMLVAFGALLSSCSKDEDPAPLTKEQATVEIADLKATYDSESTAMENNEGMKVFENLSSLNLPFVMPDVNITPVSKRISSFYPRMEQAKNGDFSAIKKSIIARSEFVFSEYVGTWEYNKQTQDWDYTSTPTDKVVIKFPYPSDNATNNAVYTISKFTFSSGLEGSGGDYIANITVNGSEVWYISFSGAFSESAISYTEKIVYTSITTPKVSYEYNQSFSMKSSGSPDDGGAMTIKTAQSWKKNGEILLSGEYNISAKSTQTAYEVVAKANLRIANIKFVFEVSYSANANGGSGTMTQNIKMGVYTLDGAKVGDIKYEPVDGVVVAMFYYVNGDKVPAAELFGEVFGEWDSMFGDIIDF